MYSGLNDSQRWRFPEVLDEQARCRADQTWITTVEGDSITFGAAALEARKVAGWFAANGVRPGERVAVMLPNSIDFVRVWLGLGYLGATAVILNTELQGAFLEHQLANSGVGLIVAQDAFVGAIVTALPRAPKLRRIAIIGVQQSIEGVEMLDYDAWRVTSPWDGALPDAQQIACVMYTSGTSGPAKGVLMPHAHCVLYGVGALEAFQITSSDRYYIVLPLFHVNGLLMQLGTTLLAGIPAVVRQRFSASEWLNDIRRHQATITNLLGALGAFVVAQPATSRDREHALRAVLNGPNVPAIEAALRARFGIADVISGFGMTEVNIPIWGKVGRSTPGANGWVDRRHFEVIIADPRTDRALDAGQLGEILVRPKVPFGFMAGYLDLPEKTVEAWRNLWFHTGDAGIMDAEGLVTFVDRIKDCIRRRGENIAATEVEAVVATLAGVAEVAAFAVPSDIVGGEDELMLGIVALPGASIDIDELGREAEARLPRFARPRFIEILEALPKTNTGKVQRTVLRQRGSATARDRGAGRHSREDKETS